ncbi:MAG: cadherin-like domain-containing protein, partial [Pseudomonadota bacterium]
KTVDEGSQESLTTDVLSATDADDPNPGDLTFTINSLPTHGELTLNGTPVGVGTSFPLSAVEQDQLRYRHNGSETSVDSFDIQVSDGGEDNALPASGRFVLLINEVIDPAPVVDQESVLLEFGDDFSSVDGDLLDSGNSTLAATVVQNNPRLIVALETLPSHGSVTIGNDGTFTYEHDGSAVYEDSFSYRVTNEDGVFTIANVQVVIEPPLGNMLPAPTTETPANAAPEQPQNGAPPEQSTAAEATASSEAFFEELEGQFGNALAQAVESTNDQVEEVIRIDDNSQTAPTTRILHKLLSELSVKQHNSVKYTPPDSEQIIVSNTSLEVVAEVQVLKPHDIVANRSFVDGLKKLDDDLQESQDNNGRRYQLASDTKLGVSLSATAGVIAWALRGGALFASAMASTPLWSSADPLRLLAQKRDFGATRDDNDVEQYFDDK